MLSPLNKLRHSRPSVICLQSPFQHSQTPIPTAYTHTPPYANVCMSCTDTHTSVHTHKSCSDLLDTLKHSTYTPGHLSAFCPYTRHTACIFTGKEQMFADLIKGYFSRNLFLVHSPVTIIPTSQRPLRITISFKELLASSPGRINISPVFTAYCLYSSYNFLLGTANTTHISYHHAHQECILLKGGDGVLFIYVTVDFPNPSKGF